MITAIVTGNAILILTLTACLLRERRQRQILQQLLKETFNRWRKPIDSNIDAGDG